jgi:hypothetical protein
MLALERDVDTLAVLASHLVLVIPWWLFGALVGVVSPWRQPIVFAVLRRSIFRWLSYIVMRTGNRMLPLSCG